MQKSFHFFIVIILIGSCTSDVTVEKMVQLDYASGSGITALYRQVYLIGDDMNYLLVSDSNYIPNDSIYLADSQLTRIPKDIKEDLEAATVQRVKGLPLVFLFGSGSLDSARDKGWIVNPFRKEKRFIKLDTLYRRLKSHGIKELNIEGATGFHNGFILSNRGNFGNPYNHLVYVGANFWSQQSDVEVRLQKVGAGKEGNSFRGVSGLDYSRQSDRLLLSVSTEHTYDNVSDGEIGKSYLWIIENMSSKRRMAAINPNRVIDLEETDKRFRGQKVESVTILSETRKEMVLALMCDNDDGKTTVFQVRVRK